MHGLRSRVGLQAILAAGAVLLLAPARAPAVSSSFDSGLEGWQAVGVEIDFTIGFPPTLDAVDLVINDGDMVHEASGGNPGGYARLTDAIEEPSSFASAPAAFLGDLSAFLGGTFSFDHRLFATGDPATVIAPYAVLITSGDPIDLDTLVWTAPAPSGATDWVHFDITLDDSDLTLLADVPVSVIDPTLPPITLRSVGLAGTKTLEEILADVSSILVAFELVDNEAEQNQEHGGIDNVELLAIPEPNMAALVGFGLVVLAGFRRR